MVRAVTWDSGIQAAAPGFDSFIWKNETELTKENEDAFFIYVLS